MSSKKRSANKSDSNEKTKKYKVKASKKETKNKETVAGKKKHSKAKKIILIVLAVILVLGIIAAGVVAGIFFGYIGDDIKITQEDLEILNKNTQVLDINGKVIANLNDSENRIVVSIDDMSKYLPDAFVAIEDKRFYEHHGVDIKRTLGATVQFIAKGGKSSYGGSTITQQLVKNLTQDKEDEGAKGVERKIKEMAKAYQVERMISKKQILELYLNLIPLGGWGKNIAGVETASIYYFSKNAKDLDLAESAFLAGINNAPNAYDPFDEQDDNTEKINKRTKTVLYEMLDQGKVSQEEYDEAVKKVDEGLPFKQGQVSSNGAYSYVVAGAINQAVEWLKEGTDLSTKAARSKLFSGGYTIHTTQDTEKQAIMETEFQKDGYIEYGREKDSEGNLKNNHTQAAMVLIQNGTGYVVATVGSLGTDENAAVNQNRGLQAERQPGSAIKPLAVVLPGLYNGSITAGTVFYDYDTTFGKNYPVKNSTKRLRLDSIAHGIGNSSNVMMVKALSVIGTEKSLDFMTNKLHITSLDQEKDNNLATALGGITNGISPLEMAAAYSTIANGGVYIEPTFIIRIQDEDGNDVYVPEQKKERVYSEQIAYVTQQILFEPVNGAYPLASYCKISGMDVGAKTGTTTNDNDRWLCGITPYYSAATWYGYDTPEEVRRGGTNPAGLLWSTVMKGVHKNLDGKRFEKPDNIVTATICLDSGKVAGENCTRKQTLSFVKGTVPSECDVHIKQQICKDSGKIATEFCPNVETRIFKTRPETEKTTAWTTNYGDDFAEPVQETCTLHTKKTVKVTNVVGKTEAAAKSELEALGLVVKIVYMADNNKANGVVLKQSLAANTTQDAGTTITLTINQKKNDNTNTNTSGGGNTNTTNTTGGGSTNTTNTTGGGSTNTTAGQNTTT